MRRAWLALPWLCVALPYLWIAARGAPLGHDASLELVRLAAYREALADGQWPPYWAGTLYAGWGSPIFLFYGHGYLVMATLLSWCTGSLASSAWLALGLFACAGALGVRALTSLVTDTPANAAPARIAVYLFAASPYLLGDALLRNANAEYAALCLAPWALVGLVRAVRDPRPGFAALAWGLGAVLATHTLTALALCALLAWLAGSSSVAQRPSPRTLVTWALGVGAGLMLSAFAWLPALVLKSRIRTTDLLTGKFDYRHNFEPVLWLFDGGRFSSGGPLVALVVVTTAWLVLRPGNLPLTAAARTWLSSLWTAALALILLQTSASLAIWERAPWLAYFQFPWRLEGPLALVTALAGAVCFHALTAASGLRVRQGVEAAICVACIAAALPQLQRMQGMTQQQRTTLEASLAPQVLMRQVRAGTARHEYLPVDSDLAVLRASASDRPVLFLEPGDGFTRVVDEPRALGVDVVKVQPGTVCLARFSYGLWHVTVDGARTPRVAGGPGCVPVQVPSGKHRVLATLGPPRMREVGLGLSLAALLGLATELLLRLRRDRRGH